MFLFGTQFCLHVNTSRYGDEQLAAERLLPFSTRKILFPNQDSGNAGRNKGRNDAKQAKWKRTTLAE